MGRDEGYRDPISEAGRMTPAALDPFLDQTGPGGVVMRPIKRWPGYFAGSDGAIYSKKTGVFHALAVHLGGRPRCQYQRVTLQNKGKKWTVGVHFLVATAWIGTRPRRAAQARHKDGDRNNNAPTNLVWGTKKANEADKRQAGTDPRGERNGQAKINEEIAGMIRTSDSSTKTLMDLYDLSRRTIQRIRSGELWGHVST